MLTTMGTFRSAVSAMASVVPSEVTTVQQGQRATPSVVGTPEPRMCRTRTCAAPRFPVSPPSSTGAALQSLEGNMTDLELDEDIAATGAEMESVESSHRQHMRTLRSHPIDEVHHEPFMPLPM